MTQVAVPELPEETRKRTAEAIRGMKDIGLPRLKYWNYDACRHHREPVIGCEFQECGGEPFSVQRVGISWLYVARDGILGDVMGAGKTNQILGLAALLKERGELTDRMLVVCQTSAVMQWRDEASRWTPRLVVIPVAGHLTKPERLDAYSSNWDIAIVGESVFRRDADWLQRVEPAIVVVDDVDPALNVNNDTHQALWRVMRNSGRRVFMNGTIVQTNLEQVYAAAKLVGGMDVFGSLESFQRRHIREETIATTDRRGVTRYSKKVVGVKRGNEFLAKFRPMFLRRGYDDLDAQDMPEVMPPINVWLELHPAQKQKYVELQKGVLTLQTEQGTTVKRAQAWSLVTYGQQICAGLGAFDPTLDGPGASVKLDWLMSRLQNPEWAEEKVKILCFMKNKNTVVSFQNRLDNVGIGYATVWGKERDVNIRRAEQKRFWEDRNCQVFMGTAAMERSLNLQCANILINVDTHLNPARMSQLAGRIRRSGSKFKTVSVVNLFAQGTQEERYLDVLRRRQALADWVYGEESELYEALSPFELLSLIRPT